MQQQNAAQLQQMMAAMQSAMEEKLQAKLLEIEQQQQQILQLAGQKSVHVSPVSLNIEPANSVSSSAKKNSSSSSSLIPRPPALAHPLASSHISNKLFADSSCSPLPIKAPTTSPLSIAPSPQLEGHSSTVSHRSSVHHKGRRGNSSSSSSAWQSKLLQRTREMQDWLKQQEESETRRREVC
jgi:uncharacterized membrane protein YdfJ with MMPL/SSD domain